MDKNAIKRYAVWARTELIDRVSQRAVRYEVSADADPNASSINGEVLSETEKKQRAALIAKVKNEGFEQVMEEVAYTWFNRFTALRFMEVNGYLPSHVRVFTDEENQFEPQILTEAIHLDIDGLDMDKVYDLKNANDKDELFKYLIITQCNALSSILPGMFQKIADYTELLFPDNILREGSVIERLIKEIPQDNFDVSSESGQLEIIGWLYQYYNDEKKDQVINIYKGTVKKEDVPAATQLFTTDWVVCYIIDNSVGRYWIERNPNSNLKNELEYFVTPKNGEIPMVNEPIKPEELTVFDPCMGSAHFGIYAFEVLMKIYREYGFSDRDAAASIIENNLYGLDIDDRAAQLAYFAIMMKARQYDRRFFSRGIQPKFYAIQESNEIDQGLIDYVANTPTLKKDISSIVNDLHDAKEYGSIIQINPVDFESIYKRFEELEEDSTLFRELVFTQLKPLIDIAKILASKYKVVATNPPYLNKYNAKLKKFVTENYKDYCGDLFSIFIYRNFGFCEDDGYSGFMTPFVWMFIKTYEELRNYIIINKNITSLIQFEYSAFEEATVPICAFILHNKNDNLPGLYFKLSDFKGDMGIQKKCFLDAIKTEKCDYFFETSKKYFEATPDSVIAYWLSEKFLNIFIKGISLQEYGYSFQGIITGNNDKYLRGWHEVSRDRLVVDNDSFNNHLNDVWVPYNKGGEYRKWYGNNFYILKWLNDGKHLTRARTENSDYHFKSGVTWTSISSGDFSCRFFPDGYLCDSKGSAIYAKKNITNEYLCAFMNSKLVNEILKATNPTISYQVMNILALPHIENEYESKISSISEKCIELSRTDWDSFETSWDFRRHPLVTISEGICNPTSIGTSMQCRYSDKPEVRCPLELCYMLWQGECKERFQQLKENEEELNRIFFDIYGLQDEFTPQVEEKNVTVRKADLQRDIKSFISYAVGCMFGRYSLDQEGLAFAGGNWDASKYSSFAADKDNIIPICSDEYFDDDIVARFVDFVAVVFGKESLEANLKYIADILGGKGSSREVIRNYFINDFYNDHVKMYQKRPIYWLFDSGKKNGFKCLIYMHRYQPDTVARIRTDYVHEQQSRYRTEIEDLQQRIQKADKSEEIKLTKQLSIVSNKADELHSYEEKIHHLADQMISIDLDDGVKVNYEKFKDVLAKIK
jgi:hypothetical protein